MNSLELKSRKRKWRLLPWSALHPVAEAMMVGAAKYGVDNWKTCPEEVFEDALLRHVTAHISGVRYDAETGLPNLALAAANALILVAKTQQELYGPTYEAVVARNPLHPNVAALLAAHERCEEASGRTS